MFEGGLSDGSDMELDQFCCSGMSRVVVKKGISKDAGHIVLRDDTMATSFLVP